MSSIGQDLHRRVNMADVSKASYEARLWLSGFLNGQEAKVIP